MNKKAMYKLTYGLYLLTAKVNGRDNGCIINTAVQVAGEPNRITVSVINGNHTCDMIRETGVFNVSSLTTDAPFSLFQKFGMTSGRDGDKFEGFSPVSRSENGLLYLTEYANAYLSARVVESQDLGSHTLFLAEVTDGEVLSEVPSATYAYYQSDIKPKPQAKTSDKKAWVCSVCGYVYEGDEIPDDFLCPLCSHGKEDFVPLVSKSVQAEPSGSATGGSKWVCTVCGYVHEGDSAPEQCPICKAPASKFVEQTGELTWADEHRVGVAEGVDPEIIAGLRENFTGECTEVGMYLAMARQAIREGYPEIGAFYKKAALEEAEHAAKFAELLGEVVTASTKKNLEMRVEAENGATAGKLELAKKAKALGLDAIHDTVHEMAKDEARHGCGFLGLLERYFK